MPFFGFLGGHFGYFLQHPVRAITIKPYYIMAQPELIGQYEMAALVLAAMIWALIALIVAIMVYKAVA